MEKPYKCIYITAGILLQDCKLEIVMQRFKPSTFRSLTELSLSLTSFNQLSYRKTSKKPGANLVNVRKDVIGLR